MTDLIEDTAGKRKDCLVKCEGCGRFLPGWIDGVGKIYTLGIRDHQCCEGHGLQEVTVQVPDEFAID